MLDEFIRTHREGTLFGNVVYRRYLHDTSWLGEGLAGATDARRSEYLGLFRRYGERYGFDGLLLMAQGYQESGLDPGRRSRAGAVGLMQLLPKTARAVGIENVEDRRPTSTPGPSTCAGWPTVTSTNRN